MARTSVRTFHQFPVLTKQVEALARRAVQAGAEEGAKVAAAKAATRRRTGKMQQMDVQPVHGTDVGYAAGFSSEAWYSDFQNDGTGGRRRRKVKQETVRRRSSPSGQARTSRFGANKAVTPLRHMSDGQRAGAQRMKAELAKGIR